MARTETLRNAEKLVEKAMAGYDASHDAAHVFRVRDLALSLAREEGLSHSPESMEIVELAALLHDVGDYKYIRDASEEKLVEKFLEAEGIQDGKRQKLIDIIQGMGFKEEISGAVNREYSVEFGVVQDADRLDAIGAIGIARCFTFGGSRNRVLHDPSIKPRSQLSKEDYMNKDKQTTLNHFHEKLLKLKTLMKTKGIYQPCFVYYYNLKAIDRCKFQAGKRRAEGRHKFMEDFLAEFYQEWDGQA